MHTYIHNTHTHGSAFFSSCVLTEFELRNTRLDENSPITHILSRNCVHMADDSACFFFFLFSRRHDMRNNSALRAIGKIAYFLIFRGVSRLSAREEGENRGGGEREKGYCDSAKIIDIYDKF